MKIVQLVMSRQYRGAELFAAQVSRELVNNGVEVLYVSLYRNKRPPVLIPEGIQYLDLDEVQRGGLRWSVIKKLATVLRDFNPDIVQANAGDTLKYVVCTRLLFRQRYKIIFRNASTVSGYLRSFMQKWVYQALYRWVDGVVSVSEFSRQDFCATFPAMQKRTVVIPNCILPAPAVILPAFQETNFNLVHVGGFTFEKNHEGVIRIFMGVKKIIPHARLWLVGDGPLKASIQQQVQVLAAGNDIVFTGFVTNPLDYIASADALILPSLIEGMPGVILEAMYCRVPVVAYGVGGIPELIRNVETGWLVQAGDEAGFIQALHHVYQGDTVLPITDRASQFVTDAFDSQVIGARFLAFYHTLL